MLIIRQVSYRSDKVLGPRLLRAMEIFEKYYSKLEKSPVYLLALVLSEYGIGRLVRAQLHAFQRPRSRDEFEDYLAQELTDLGDGKADRVVVCQRPKQSLSTSVTARN